MNNLDGETLVIAGRAGSFGSGIPHGFIETNIKEIRIFSRDEKKQDDLHHALQRMFGCLTIEMYANGGNGLIVSAYSGDNVSPKAIKI